MWCWDFNHGGFDICRQRTADRRERHRQGLAEGRDRRSRRWPQPTPGSGSRPSRPVPTCRSRARSPSTRSPTSSRWRSRATRSARASPSWCTRSCRTRRRGPTCDVEHLHRSGAPVRHRPGRRRLRRQDRTTAQLRDAAASRSTSGDLCKVVTITPATQTVRVDASDRQTAPLAVTVSYTVVDPVNCDPPGHASAPCPPVRTVTATPGARSGNTYPFTFPIGTVMGPGCHRLRRCSLFEDTLLADSARPSVDAGTLPGEGCDHQPDEDPVPGAAGNCLQEKVTVRLDLSTSRDLHELDRPDRPNARTTR